MRLGTTVEVTRKCRHRLEAIASGRHEPHKKVCRVKAIPGSTDLPDRQRSSAHRGPANQDDRKPRRPTRGRDGRPRAPIDLERFFNGSLTTLPSNGKRRLTFHQADQSHRGHRYIASRRGPVGPAPQAVARPPSGSCHIIEMTALSSSGISFSPLAQNRGLAIDRAVGHRNVASTADRPDSGT